MAQKIRLVTPLERTLYLKSLDPLQGLGSDDLAQIAQDAEERFFRRGDTVYKMGEPITEIHIITEGSITATGPDIGEITLGEREAIGALVLLARSEDGIDAVADSDVRTLAIQDQVIFDVFEDNFRILHHQILNLARRTLEARKNIPDGTYLAPAEELDFKFERNMDLVERILFMRRGGGFQERNMDALIQLAVEFEEEQIEAGKQLWQEGDQAGFSYVILSGTVRCTLPNGNHFRAGPGYPLGNLESQALSPRWYNAVTETPLIALRGHTDTFIDVLEDHFSLALDFLAALARNLMHIIRDAPKAGDDSEAA